MDYTEKTPLKKRWSKELPPDLSDLRIVLLGKSVSENSRVGNFLLGRAAFDREALPDVIERVGGRVKDRYVMVINSPQLLQKHISDHQITQTVRECVYLSDPGPHVVVLLLKHEQCSAEDQECVEKVLDSFSERVYQHTMVLITQESNETNHILQKIIQKCCNRHFSLQKGSSPDDLLQTFEDIVQMNDGCHLVCAKKTYEEPKTISISSLESANVDVLGILKIIDTFDRPSNASTEGYYTVSGAHAKKTMNEPGERIPKAVAFAGAGVGLARAEFSVFEVEAKGPNASACAEANVVGAGAIARAEVASASAKAGPVGVKVGLGFDTGATVGLGGVEVKILGTGVTIGPNIGVSVLGSEVSCSVM